MTTEKQLIDAYKLEDLVRSNSARYHHVDDVIAAIAGQPTVDAVEVVHGQWEQVQRWATKAKYRCSVCGREIMSATTVNIAKYPYCHCGAKMEDENK